MSRESSKKRVCEWNTMMEEAGRQSLARSLSLYTKECGIYKRAFLSILSLALPNYFTCKTLSKYPLIAAPFKPHFRWLTSLKSLFTHSRAISSLPRDASGLKMRSDDVFHSTLVGQQSPPTFIHHVRLSTFMRAVARNLQRSGRRRRRRRKLQLWKWFPYGQDLVMYGRLKSKEPSCSAESFI